LENKKEEIVLSLIFSPSFVIDKDKINYYLSEDLKKQQGSFQLEASITILYAEEKRNCFTLKNSSKSLVLQAISEDQVLEWLYSIKAVCDKL
jgi:hypothetical protein